MQIGNIDIVFTIDPDNIDKMATSMALWKAFEKVYEMPVYCNLQGKIDVYLQVINHLDCSVRRFCFVSLCSVCYNGENVY